MIHLNPRSLRYRVLRILPILFLAALVACSAGSGTDDNEPTDTQPDSGHMDIVVDTPPVDGIPDIEPDLPPEVAVEDANADEDVEAGITGDVTPEIVPDVGPCGGICDDGDPCTLDECDPESGCVNSPIEGCCPGQFPFALGFEAGLDGGTVVDLVDGYPDAPDLSPLTWQVVDDKAWSGTSSLYFGNPEMGNYHNDHRVASQFATAPLSLEAGYAHTLTLQTWIDVEEGIWSDYLVIFVRAGGDDYPVWTKDDFNVSMGTWNLVTVDLTPFAGETVSVVVLFDTHDEKENFGGGVYLDDLSVERACEPLTCTGLSDCFTISPCLDGQCEAGQCVYTWDPECCLSPAECEDWDGCTLEFCDDNSCYSQPDPDPFCCNANEECADEDDLCTVDVCKNNVCTYLPSGAEGCCAVDAECDDTDPCTKDLCTEQACVYINLCCAADEDCDDGDDQCTADQCIDGACYFIATGAEGCCVEELVDETFEDDATPDFTLESTLAGVGFEPMMGDAYSGAKALILEAVDPSGSFTATATLGVTEIPPQGATLSFGVKLTMGSSGDAGQNEFRVLVGDDVMWSSSATLNNYLPVTLDLSPYAGDPGPVVFEFQVNPIGSNTYWAGIDNVLFTQDCCSADEDCEDGNPCTSDVCPGSNAVCQFPAIEGCCLISPECDDGDVCTEDVCTGDHVCEHWNLCCDGDEECDDEDDVCTDDLCINSFCQYIPTGAAGCCIPLAWQDDFEAGLGTWTITGGAGEFGWQANQAKSVSGSFSLAYSNSSGNDYDDNAFGTALSPPMDLPDQSGIFLVFQLWIDIENSFDDLYLYLVTDEGEVSLGNWTGSQAAWQEISIDVTEWGGQTVQVRFEFDSDGSVSSGAGVFIDDLSITQECCSDDAECEDGNPCTTDSCPGIDSLCAFIPVEGCCIADGECADGEPCTQDTCTSSQGGECLNIWICCESDDDCDDGEDVCTEDLCIDSFCQFIPTGAFGCCTPVTYLDDFEGGIPGWDITGSDGDFGWQASQAKSVSGSYSLAYSNSSGTEYNNSAFGTALSPLIDLPDESDVSLVFQLWYELESCCDDLDLFIITDAGKVSLGNWGGTGATYWQEVTIDVNEWAGQTVQFRFEFSSDGSVTYSGVFIDDLSIIQECCSVDAECEDGDPCTTDFCPGLESLCVFTPVEGCCVADEECADSDPCTQDTCTSSLGGECLNIGICCESDDDCDDGEDVCTEDICVDDFCQFLFTGAPGCCEPLLWEDAFESGQGGWVFQNASASPSWHLSTVKASDGGTALAFSDAAGGSTGTGQDSAAISPTIEVGVQPGVAVTFQVWYDTETNFDWCKLWVDHDGGSTQLVKFTGHNEAFWQEKTYSLEEWAGQEITLRFEWHCDGSVSYPGIWIDEMSITQGCCNADVDCADDNPCTVDDCPGLESMCNNTWTAGCCLNDADCDDWDPCTTDSCPVAGEGCQNLYICCQTDEDCPDDCDCPECPPVEGPGILAMSDATLSETCLVTGGVDVDEDPETSSGQGDCDAGIDSQLSVVFGDPNFQALLPEDFQQILIDKALEAALGNLLVDFSDAAFDGSTFDLPLYFGVPTDPTCDPQVQSCDYSVPHSLNFDALCNPDYSITANVQDGDQLHAGSMDADYTFETTFDEQPIVVKLHSVHIQGTLDITTPVIGFEGVIGAAVKKAELIDLLTLVAADNPDLIAIAAELGATPEALLQLAAGLLENSLDEDIDTDGDGQPDAVSFGGTLAAGSASVGVSCGDFVCSGDETCGTCTDDCGECP